MKLVKENASVVKRLNTTAGQQVADATWDKDDLMSALKAIGFVPAPGSASKHGVLFSTPMRPSNRLQKDGWSTDSMSIETNMDHNDSKKWFSQWYGSLRMPSGKTITLPATKFYGDNRYSGLYKALTVALKSA